MKFPNRILIVDDVPLDRTALRRVVASEFPDSVILEASNADEMWARLDKRCELLFQDISLIPTDGVVDSEGIRLLYDVIETFPSLPVIIVSGHMPEKWKDVFDLQKQHGSQNRGTRESRLFEGPPYLAVHHLQLIFCLGISSIELLQQICRFIFVLFKRLIRPSSISPDPPIIIISQM